MFQIATSLPLLGIHQVAPPQLPPEARWADLSNASARAEAGQVQDKDPDGLLSEPLLDLTLRGSLYRPPEGWRGDWSESSATESETVVWPAL